MLGALPGRGLRGIDCGMKRHFDTLDAMRGLAAIAVATYHMRTTLGPIAVAHGYLAVDFFFGLSGLVIAHAYGDRLRGGLSAAAFMRQRLIRLYPLYALGTAIGIALFVAPHLLKPLPPVPGAALGITLASAALMLPAPVAWGDRPWLMPFDIAAWSLVLELWVNCAFAITWRWLHGRVLAIAIAVSGATLVALGVAHGSIDFGAVWPTVPQALVRTVFSFCIGVAIARGARAPARVTRLAAALPIVFCVSLLVRPSGAFGAAYDLFCAMLLYPAVVLLGARIEMPQAQRLRWLGTISYPLYILHGPIVGAATDQLERHGPASAIMRGALGVMLLGVLVAASGWIVAHFDQPLRTWLARYRLKHPETGDPRAVQPRARGIGL